MKDLTKKLVENLKNSGWKKENIEKLVSLGDYFIKEASSLKYSMLLQERAFSNILFQHFLKSKFNDSDLFNQLLAASKLSKQWITILEEQIIPNNIGFTLYIPGISFYGESMVIDVGDEELMLYNIACYGKVQLKARRLCMYCFKVDEDLEIETEDLEASYVSIHGDFVINGMKWRRQPMGRYPISLGFPDRSEVA